MAKQTRPTEASIRDMFIMILMFLGFLRESEVVLLRPEDVWVEVIDDQEVLFIFVEKMKNDQFRRGHTIVIGAAPHSPLCPVKWHRLYARVRRSSKSLFHSVFKSARPLTKTKPNEVLKKLLAAIGVDPDSYGSHSLRRGGASAAANHRIAIHVLARHGNWKSDAVFAYISDDMQQRLSVGRAILGN